MSDSAPNSLFFQSIGIEAGLEKLESLHAPAGLEPARLARAFPSLVGLDGVAPFDPDRLEKAAIVGGVSLQAWHAVRFVLTAQDANRTSRVGRFDFWQAWRAWDLVHKQAFLASTMGSTILDIRKDFDERTRHRQGW
ncbi:MAG: hypothetical protein NXI24_05150 [bacterium]|nr:hypothetical protein [bacterium]